VPQGAIIRIQPGTEPELMAIHGPRLVSPLRAALRLFAQGVGSALETASLIADLERRNRELSYTRAELVRHERLAALGEMAASVAHEVRNPVGVIANAVSTIRRRRDGETGRSELLSIIEEECFRLERMVRDLLEFARPRQVSFMLEALSEIAEEAIAVTSSQSDPAVRRAKFVVEQATDVPKVRVDRDLLRQALVNLLINAAQASPERATVVVRIGSEKIGDAVTPSISVIDRGCGIPEDSVGRIFDPFFTTRAQGSGLGLAVVKRIVDALRAEISVEGKAGHGATFTLNFRP
jgi:signal transduction histidine kinase